MIYIQRYTVLPQLLNYHILLPNLPISRQEQLSHVIWTSLGRNQLSLEQNFYWGVPSISCYETHYTGKS